MTEDTRAQIWAETMILVAEGETSYLDAAMELEAAKMQREAIEYDDREGDVIDYLETLLPADWYSWDMAKRVDFFQQRDVLDVKVDCTMRRTKVCAREIFCECWGRPKNAWKRQDGYDIARHHGEDPRLGKDRQGSEGPRLRPPASVHKSRGMMWI